MEGVAAVVPRHPKADVEQKGLQIKVLTDPRIIERIKVMDTYNFPVTYTEKYYTNIVDAGFHNFNLIAYYHELLVGSCTCRLESTATEGVFRLYVMTIGVLSPYRRLGIGAKMMQLVLDHVAAEGTIGISEVALHVQVGSPAFYFYTGFGFEVREEVKEYYKDLEVRDALLMTRVVPQPQLGKKEALKRK
jgi:ribosomal protein S18 acetylase RimI-like enzyme